jgi:hypothetical protein
MFTEADIKQVEKRGSEIRTVENQIENFKKGFPFLKLHGAATPKDGIMVLGSKEIENLVARYDSSAIDKQIVKFVPASGAASRMFKTLYSFLDICGSAEQVKSEFEKSSGLQGIHSFFQKITDFAFYNDLEQLLQKQGKSIKDLLEKGDYEPILRGLLDPDGLSYGNSPKGLLKFHRYEHEARTPVMEHLAEGALYAQSEHKVVNIHFTVSPEHKQRFQQHIADISPTFEKAYGVRYKVSFSEQKAYTDTIAVDLGNEPFRNSDGSLLFRPAGHGALLANLNDIDADIVFVKNIDNVVPDGLKPDTITYKKALAGILLEFQNVIFQYMQQLDESPEKAPVEEMMRFVEDKLKIKEIPAITNRRAMIDFLRNKLNRPLRICGMVKNEGEPGGGPFYAVNSDGTVSLQIAESSQINFDSEVQKSIAQDATHFNPVDLVCAMKDFQGNPFDLTKFVDPKTGFISQKSKDGNELKAQELPGLWNGSMADWNTVFVEVPISTFNPVKTVNDLLRPQHQ